MNATSDLAALLNAILSHPDEDTPRLMYADALDALDPVRDYCPHSYHKPPKFKDGEDAVQGVINWAKIRDACPQCGGNGTILDTTNAARAEFIRVQCELAKCPTRLPEAGQPRGCNCGQTDCHWCPLQWREARLQQEHEARWRAAGKCHECDGYGCYLGSAGDKSNPTCDRCHGTGDTGGLLRRFVYPGSDGRDCNEPVRIEWSRGFMDRITVPELPNVVEERQRTSKGPQLAVYRATLVPTPWVTSALGTTPERGTIRELVPLACKPQEHTSGAFAWCRASAHPMHPLTYESARIPDLIFDLMPGNAHAVIWLSFPTREDALSVLGRALVTFVRNNKKKQS